MISDETDGSRKTQFGGPHSFGGHSGGHFDSVETAVAEIAAGKPVVVIDDTDDENEGDLIFAAELATPELVAFLVQHSSRCSPRR